MLDEELWRLFVADAAASWSSQMCVVPYGLTIVTCISIDKNRDAVISNLIENVFRMENAQIQYNPPENQKALSQENI